MKNLKIVWASLLLLIAPIGLYGQTNSFPATGNVGIGTASPTSKLQVVFNTTAGNRTFAVENNGTYLYRAGDTSGWALSYGFLSNDKSISWGGYGAYGVGNSRFNYWFIGNQYDTAVAYFLPNGNVGIGTSNPSQKLSVNGTIRAKEVNVIATGWADYVFKPDYELIPLSEVAKYIQENGHLPNVPTEVEVMENGVNLLEMNVKLLEKVEELTLYLVQQQDRINELEKDLRKLKDED
jgi:hypothetical protein